MSSRKMFLYLAPVAIPIDKLDSGPIDLRLAVTRWRDLSLELTARAAEGDPYSEEEEATYDEATQNCAVALQHWEFYRQIDAPVLQLQLGMSKDGKIFLLSMVLAGTMAIAASRQMAEQVRKAVLEAGFSVVIDECQVPRSSIRPGETWPDDPEDVFTLGNDGIWQEAEMVEEPDEAEPQEGLGTPNMN